jgi:hypothetical protein
MIMQRSLRMRMQPAPTAVRTAAPAPAPVNRTAANPILKAYAPMLNKPAPAPAPASTVYSKNPIFNKLITQVKAKQAALPPPAVLTPSSSAVPVRGTMQGSPLTPAPARGIPSGVASSPALPVGQVQAHPYAVQYAPSGAPSSLSLTPGMSFADTGGGFIDQASSSLGVSRQMLVLGGVVLIAILLVRR